MEYSPVYISSNYLKGKLKTMTYKEALSIFNLDTVAGKDAKVLTKDYRKLVRKWHPDLNHSPNAMKMTSDINEAYNILISALERIGKVTGNNPNNRAIIISLDQLIEMYATGSTMNGKVTSAEMIHRRSFISIDGTLTHNNITRKISCIIPFREDNDYTINQEISVLDMNTEETVRIKMLNKDIKLNIKYGSATMRMKFGDRIYINVEISKEPIREEIKA